MWLCKYFALFTVFSCIGWIYETIYCTVKSGRWSNRGFLFGPVCPIYGVGAIAIGIIYDYAIKNDLAGDVTWWEIFAFAYLGSVVLEYVTSFVLEKKFHAYWWDYSDMPLNINGRVCVPASIGFGCAGLLIYYVIYPPFASVAEQISPVVHELLALLFMAVIAADTALTVATLSHLIQSMTEMEDALNRQMEHFVSNVEERKVLVGEKVGTVVESAKDLRRETMRKEHMEHLLGSMGGMSKNALTRIKGFRPHSSDQSGAVYDHLKHIWLMAKMRTEPVRAKANNSTKTDRKPVKERKTARNRKEDEA